MIKNVFDNNYAECLILRDQADGSAEKGEAVGLALVSHKSQSHQDSTGIRADPQYFFNYSTWLGTPGLYVSLRKDAVSKAHSAARGSIHQGKAPWCRTRQAIVWRAWRGCQRARMFPYGVEGSQGKTRSSMKTILNACSGTSHL